MTHEEQVEELRKCNESKAYFYNKYVKRPEDPELTDKDILRLEAYCNPVVRRMRNPGLFIEIHLKHLPEWLNPQIKKE